MNYEATLLYLFFYALCVIILGPIFYDWFSRKF